MTDRQDETIASAATSTDVLQARLERHFTAEIRRAERDIGRGWLGLPVPAPAVPARHTRRTLPSLVVGTIIVIGSVLGLQALVVGAPGSTSSPSASAGLGEATASASPFASVARTVTTSPDGIPSMVDGQTVMRPADAAARLSTATDDTPLLVGGWFLTQALPCPYTPPRYVPPAPFLTCNGNALWSQPGDPTSVNLGPNSVYALAITPDSAQIPQGPVVLQMHTNDPRAATCSADLRAMCRAAVIVDRVAWPVASQVQDIGSRYPDGIPSLIDGAPVLRPPEASARAGTAADDTPFLVGGWRGGPWVAACIPRIRQSPDVTPNPLVTPCAGYVIFDGPSGLGQASVNLVSLGVALPYGAGPAVFRVHVRDPLAATCQPAQTAACERALVVEGVVWTGDAVTETAPLAIQDVLRRLARATPDLIVTPFSPASRQGCNPGWPAGSWFAGSTSFGMRRIGRILVFPNPADADATSGRLSAGGYTGQPNASGLSCTVMLDGLVTSTWLRQDNVIVEVLLPTGSDFVDKVRHDLATEP